jgi:hypothetical protein
MKHLPLIPVILAAFSLGFETQASADCQCIRAGSRCAGHLQAHC